MRYIEFTEPGNNLVFAEITCSDDNLKLFSHKSISLRDQHHFCDIHHNRSCFMNKLSDIKTSRFDYDDEMGEDYFGSHELSKIFLESHSNRSLSRFISDKYNNLREVIEDDFGETPNKGKSLSWIFKYYYIAGDDPISSMTECIGYINDNREDE